MTDPSGPGAGTSVIASHEVPRYWAAAAFVAVFAVVQYGFLPATGPVNWWADIAWTLAALLAGAECLRTARALSGCQRRAWMAFAAGCLAWAAGMLIWDYRELVQRQITPFPDYSDIGFLASAPLFVAGILYLSARRGIGPTLKDTADLGLIITVVAFGSWLTLAEPLRDPDLSVMYRGTALAFPVLYLSAFVFALLVLLRRTADTRRVILLLFMVSLGLHAVTDSVYAYSLLERTYQPGHYLDVLWIAAFALIYCAAVLQQSRGAATAGDGDSLQASTARMRRADTLVFTGVLLAVGAAAHWNRTEMVLDPVYLAPFLAVLAVFLGLREWANHRIQMRLIAEIRASEREVNRILDYLDDTYYRIDMNGIIERVSPSVARLLGYAPHELVGRRARELSAEDGGWQRMLDAMRANAGVVHNYESRLLHRDGSLVWVATNAHQVRDDAGNVVAVEGTSRDVSEHKAAEETMRKLSGALQQSADSVMITDRDGVIEYVNPAFEQTTGFAGDEAINRTPRILNSGEHEPDYFEHLWSTVRGGEVFRDVMINKRRDGTLYYEDKTITPLMDDDGNTTHFVATGKDISEQMRDQERLYFIAHHDVLTGLPNRALFLDRVGQVIAHTRRHDRLAAVLFMDLDQFKNINDSLGHEVGDKLLIGVAERLAAALRPGDTVARFGGDEFVVLLDDVSSYNDITQVVEKLRHTLHAPIAVDGMSLHVTGTIGISVHPHDGEDGPSLLKNADNAMYRAKEQGRDTYAFYSEEMSTRVRQRLLLENKLRSAVDNDEFEVYYQPQIDIVEDRIQGVEALLRWRNPSGESVGPAEFVPLLEDTGFIIPVGDQVLRTACAQVRSWNRAVDRRLDLAVNISARQFTDSRFADTVAAILNETGFDPLLLQLEMTESVYLRTTGATQTTVRELDEAGIWLAIDDFGTGYSALNYLKRLPIHVLKIDRSFITGIPDASDNCALTIAAIAMGEGLGLRVVAEGVETIAQLEFLREHGCRYVQGFLFSRPLPASRIETLLNSPDPPSAWIDQR